MSRKFDDILLHLGNFELFLDIVTLRQERELDIAKKKDNIKVCFVFIATVLNIIINSQIFGIFDFVINLL